MPENIRETAGKANVKRGNDSSTPSFTWIIEISSQIIFSTSASVNFELLVGRDEKSVDLGFSSLAGHPVATPGQLQDHQQSKRSKTSHSAAQPKGVFSHAVTLVVEDTESLWNKPTLPEWEDEGKERGKRRSYADPGDGDDFSSRTVANEVGATNGNKEPNARKRKRVHLVVLTHGLHSNLGADMLYLKESIDAAAKEARQSARERRAREKSKHVPGSSTGEAQSKNEGTSPKKDQPDSSTAPLSGGQDDLDPGDETDEEDEEEVIVRGFNRNATRTERGIQYLGKRLAKWVLSMTYPDQPYLPTKKSLPRKLSRVFTSDQKSEVHQNPTQHNHSSIHRPAHKPNNLAYKITSISFISHSLGGLTQTYAIAYIHKHSPNFFNEIKPINFVAMAAPFLGLSNENPLYVKFALDFGLVGRTGQDLGLTWRAPTMVRSGWGAMIGGIGSEGQRAHRQPDPGSKPLLRILPTGHTHQVLKLFRNRTVYSNVVNDGIVPLRTSCLLFLDWSGLDRVEKARRENGLIGTMAGWGWSEITGANKSANRRLRPDHGNDAWSQSDISGDEGAGQGGKAAVPQPEENAVRDGTTAEGNESRKSRHHPDPQDKPFKDEVYDATKAKEHTPQQPTHPLAGFLSFLRPSQPKSQPKSHHRSPKNNKIYKRSQTFNRNDDVASISSESSSAVGAYPSRPGAVRGDSIMEDPDNDFAPPKTSIFEAAGDILNPPLPTKEFLTNPKGRPRTIFHDRIYHPEDIPPPPTKKKREGLKRSFSSESRNGPSRVNTDYDGQSKEMPDTSSMKVEEKIARAYHHGLSWRKVLVRLEPDAHNNMVVRRMFANAYGWPVIKHLVDTHFGDTYAATTADVDESNKERAKPPTEAVGEHGEEVRADAPNEVKRTNSERYEAKDSISELTNMEEHSMNSSNNRPSIFRQESAQWDDSMFDVTDDDDEPDQSGDADHGFFFSKDDSPKGTSDTEIAEFLTRSPPPVDQSVGGKSPTKAPAGGTCSVGLGKSVEERLHAGKSSRRTMEGQGEDGSGNLEDEVTRIRIEDGQ